MIEKFITLNFSYVCYLLLNQNGIFRCLLVQFIGIKLGYPSFMSTDTYLQHQLCLNDKSLIFTLIFSIRNRCQLQSDMLTYVCTKAISELPHQRKEHLQLYKYFPTISLGHRMIVQSQNK